MEPPKWWFLRTYDQSQLIGSITFLSHGHLGDVRLYTTVDAWFMIRSCSLRLLWLVISNSIQKAGFWQAPANQDTPAKSSEGVPHAKKNENQKTLLTMFNNDPNDTRQELPTRLPPFTIDEMVVNDGLFLPTVSLDLKGTSKPDNHDFHMSSHQIWFSRFLYMTVPLLVITPSMTRPSEAIQRCRCDQEHLEHFYEEVFLELAKFGEAWRSLERRCHKGRSPWNPS